MYNFIDVNEASEGAVLPSEALKINGEYIENLIDGYKTLNVSGREALSPELSTYTAGIRDGSKLQGRRFPERVITVTYQLIAESSEAFREAFNKLGGILNVENAELIFDDEQDKFFVGTPSGIGEVAPGLNAVVGKFEILCSDPFKYSVIEYEAQPDAEESSILINYGGTYKAYPILEADFFKETEVEDDGETSVVLTGGGDCGYVAFFTEDEKIIQLGDPNEVDGTNTLAKSQTMINQTFLTNTSWGTTAKSLWSVNNGNVLPSDIVQGGTVGTAVASTTSTTAASTSGTLLKATSTASAPNVNYTVTAKATSRTESSVKVTVSITGSLATEGSYFLSGYVLNASVYMGGSWHNVTLKKASDQWRGRTGHTVNTTFTVSGLSQATTSLTGIKFKVTRGDGGGTTGVLNETACSNLKIMTYAESLPANYYLTATSYGTASNKWHGASITRNTGSDASGEAGAANFTLTYKQKMCIGSNSADVAQMGAFQMQIIDTDGNHLAGVRIHKNLNGKQASMLFYIKREKVYSTMIDLSHNNKYFGSAENAVQTSTITKSGSKITFSTGGITKTFTDDAIAACKGWKITYMFEQWSTAKPLAYNGLYWAKFVKNNCNTMKDIPNKFSANDIVIADCKNGEIMLNSIPSPHLGALGNDWETFTLKPGMNQIGIAFSDWVDADKAPTMKVRYREVFL